MARYLGPRERIERRVGEKLFLKGERSHSPKAALTKRPFPPGIHGKARARKLSEFGQQLKSKQKVRNMYRMLEKQFKSTVKAALLTKKETNSSILEALESRLDNVVFRSGFAQSRDQARQLVNHGHILVNKKKVRIPSYRVKQGDTITIREGSKRMPFFANLMPIWLKNYQAPGWITLDANSTSAIVKGKPDLMESGVKTEDLQAIVEYYSR